MYIAAVSGTGGPPSSEQPFRALLAAAVSRPDAAYGLACAYAELPPDDRRQLITALITDAAAEQLDIGAVLARVCAVESDPELLGLLVSHLRMAGVPLVFDASSRATGEPSRNPACRILLAGDATSGAAVLVRPTAAADTDQPALHDVLGLRWHAASGTMHAVRERVADAELAAFASRLQPEATLEASPLDFAAEIVAHAVWQHRRAHGELPEGLADFADVIGPQAR